MQSADTSIRTTVSVRADWYNMVQAYSHKQGISINEVITELLEKQISVLSDNVQCREGTLRYQARGYMYKPVHITLSCFQYSRFRDVMLCFRFCLSYILSLALESFDTIMGNAISADSYPGEAYTTIVTVLNNMNIFLHMWGIPTEQQTINVPPG